MTKLTLDTNVLISGTFWSGDSFKIIESISKGELLCVLSKEILNEYKNVLKRDEIMEKTEAKSLIVSKASEKVINESTIVEPKIKQDVIRDDPSDNKILECAREGKVDYIITNDRHLLKIKEFESIKIVTPKEFLQNKQKIC